ncbi:serine/threonine-protein kinase Rio1p [Trichomonascus vanleenenianus]|uniref:protein kinase RIO1 n=1 Tax=Trichomonascus vanleenenianus TaxID=2268995 RepID=UPI003ECACC51
MSDYEDEYISDSGAGGSLTKQVNKGRRSAVVKNDSAKDASAPGEKSKHDAMLSRYMGRIKLEGDDYFGRGSRGSKLNNSANVADKADRATTDQVLDPQTRMILFKMINRGVVYEINGSVSTGKEANVYHAETENGEARAIKIYKTAILVFKDRERYVAGEFRFRQGYSKRNHRQMVRLWAEKETRNLKRLYQAGVPVPKPLNLDKHVLVMEFLGREDGFPSPRLRDADIEPQEYKRLYYQVLAYMRIMYHQCRLVHGDLSEYNMLYHEKKLYIIDVSQSVEHDHPHSLEFLRMDIKNVNNYFMKDGGVEPFSERAVFRFITKVPEKGKENETCEELMEQLAAMPVEDLTEQDRIDDEVFRSVYIPQNLEQVYDVERDTELVERGEAKDLIYADLLKNNNEEDNDDEYSDDESEFDSEDDDVGDVWVEKPVREKKFADRDVNKDRKKAVKEAAKLKRENKMKKATKKKLIKNSTTKYKKK